MKIRSGSLGEIEYCSKVLILFVGKPSLVLFLFYKHYQQVKDLKAILLLSMALILMTLQTSLLNTFL